MSSAFSTPMLRFSGNFPMNRMTVLLSFFFLREVGKLAFKEQNGFHWEYQKKTNNLIQLQVKFYVGHDILKFYGIFSFFLDFSGFLRKNKNKTNTDIRLHGDFPGFLRKKEQNGYRHSIQRYNLHKSQSVETKDVSEIWMKSYLKI